MKVVKQIETKIFKEQRAYEMAALLEMFQKSLRDEGLFEEFVNNYKVQNLKKRLMNRYSDKLMF